jgi:hypothetical protein
MSPLVAEYVYVVELHVEVFARDDAHADELAGEAARAVREHIGDDQLFVAHVGAVRRRDERDIPGST